MGSDDDAAGGGDESWRHLTGRGTDKGLEGKGRVTLLLVKILTRYFKWGNGQRLTVKRKINTGGGDANLGLFTWK